MFEQLIIELDQAIQVGEPNVPRFVQTDFLTNLEFLEKKSWITGGPFEVMEGHWRRCAWFE